MQPPLIIFLNFLLLFLFSKPDKSVNVLNTTFDKLEYFFFVSYLLLIRSIKSEPTFSSRSTIPASFARSLCFSINCGTSIVSFPYCPSFIILDGCLLVWNPVPSPITAWLASRALIFFISGTRVSRLFNTYSSFFVIGSPASLFCLMFAACAANFLISLPAFCHHFRHCSGFTKRLILLETPLLHHNLYRYLG